jgi:predicted permease
MSWRPSDLWRTWLSREHREQDLERELRCHLDVEAEEQSQAGVPDEEARYAAQRALGNATLIREDTRAMWEWSSVERLWQDFRYAARIMARRPVFTAIAVLSLAIALGANTAVFSFARAVVFKSLPVPGAERLVILRQRNETFHMENCCFPYRFFAEMRKQDTGFEDMLAVNPTEIKLTDAGQTEKLKAEIVSGNYFQMFGVRPAAGRLLSDSDQQAGAASHVCVISYRLWQERFGGKPDVIGRRVLLDAEPYQIVGVSEAGFLGAALHEPHDLQVPGSTAAYYQDAGDAKGWGQLVARLKPGVTLDQAQARLNVIGKQVERVAGPKMSQYDDFLLRDGSQGVDSKKEQFGKPLLLLLLLVAVVLLVACANLAALLLVRSVERMREAGMRVALGASRPALFRQFLVESLLLSVTGGLAGWLLAQVLIQALLDLLGPQGDGLLLQVRPDKILFLFSAAAALVAGLVFGLLPAWRAAHADPMPAVHGTPIGSGRKWLVSRFIVAGQVALSLALLFSAGLFAQTLRNLRSIDLGFHPENVALLRIDLSGTTYRDQRAANYFDELLRRARQLPDTRAASLAQISVLSGSMEMITVTIPGYVSPSHLTPTTYFNTISSGYFRTLGIPLEAGRDFTANESAGNNNEVAVIVNEHFAHEFFAGDALGKEFLYGGGIKSRVVGIAGTAKFLVVKETPHSVIYLPTTRKNYFPDDLFLQVRSTGDPRTAMGELRALHQGLDPRVPIGSIATMQMQIDHALSRERLLSFLSISLALVAVALAAIGLYGVLSFSVVRRMREIGIRMAVGAERQRILSLFLKESTWVVVGGIAFGTPLAFLSGKLASSLLYGVQPQDSGAAVLAMALLIGVALAATAIPAWRASRVDPIVALRHE